MDAVGKLVYDTLYNIEKDVMKVLLLAAASVAYRALRDTARSSLATGLRPVILRGSPAALMLTFIGVFSLLKLYNRPTEQLDADEVSAPVPTSPLEYLRAHPTSVFLALLTCFAIDRSNLLVGLERVALAHASSIVELAGPAVKKVLTLGRPAPAPPVTPGWRRPLQWALPSALIWQLYSFERARAARAMKALVEKQRQVGIRRVCVWARLQWNTLLSVMSSAFGILSALKYLKLPRP